MWPRYSIPISILSQAKSKLLATLRKFSPDIVGLSIKYIDTTNRFDTHIFFNTVPKTLAVIIKWDLGNILYDLTAFPSVRYYVSQCEGLIVTK
jgi:hypothetical protein